MRPDNINRILVIRTDRIGDVVLTTPALRALREACVHAHITMMVSPATRDLVVGLPYIDEVMVDDRQGQNRGFLGFLQLCRSIRKGHFDTAIIFHTKRRYNLACFLAGVMRRVGYKNNKMGILLTHPLADERHLGTKHEAQYCLDVMALLGAKADSLQTVVAQDPRAKAWALSWHNEHVPQNFQLIVIHPGASDDTKCWPASHFAQLIDKIHLRYMAKVVLVGEGRTHTIARQITQITTSQVYDLTNQTTLAQTTALLALSKVLISNDSGPVHVANALGVGVVSLFLRDQPGINAQRWKPLGPKAVTLMNKPHQAVRLDHKGQMVSGEKTSISVEEVMTATDDLMRRDAQSMFVW